MASQPRTHAIAAQTLSTVFLQLGISASLFLGGDEWFPIYVHPSPDVVGFELAHGLEAERKAHNERSAKRARRGGALVSEHSGFYDLFAPVGESARFGTLVVGPFARDRPTAGDLRARWRRLTGRSARLSDPEFARYMAVTLGTTTLGGSDLAAFQRLLESLALLFAGQGDPDLVTQEGEALRQRLIGTRMAERMWTSVRTMLDEGVWREWLGSYRSHDLRLLGVKRLPEHALVGLIVSREADVDPIEDLLRRDAFLRACAAFAINKGGAVCGRIGDHGVVVLVDEPSTGSRLRGKVLDLSERLGALGRRFGMRLHWGVSAAGQPLILPRRYQAALSTAEHAMTRGVSLAFAEPRTDEDASSLGDPRRELVRALVESPTALAPRFERYLEAVTAHCGYGMDATRAHLEAGLDQVMDGLRATSTLDEKSARELMLALRRTAGEAATINELAMAYRSGIAEIERALQVPMAARQDRSLRRVIAYVRDHLAEPLSLERVSRVAGFAPGYFSKLFAKNEKMTFRAYTQRLRIDRAKQMLATTTLSVERVGQLSGFGTRHRFHAIFKRLEQMTPVEYRLRRGGRQKRFRVVPGRRAGKLLL